VNYGKAAELLTSQAQRIAELEHQVERLKDFVNPAQDTLDPDRHER
jgi:hypothetical protein